MRAASLLLALLTAAVVVGSVGAAITTNPKDIILRSSDMPSGAKRTRAGAKTGTIKIPNVVKGKAAYVTYRFKNGRATELVANAAGVVSSGSAHAAFLKLKKDLSTAGFKPLRLPKYGDEQVGLGLGIRTASTSIVLVRSGSTIWELAVAGYPGFTKAKSKSELEKYAQKVASRA